jgi:hypothetical protein
VVPEIPELLNTWYFPLSGAPLGKILLPLSICHTERIVGNLQKLCMAVAKSMVEKYRAQPPRSPSPTWKTFLNHHRSHSVARDFFTVPTVTFMVLVVLVILTHARRWIVHCNVTEHPTVHWTAQQMVEVLPWERRRSTS